jgi:TatA/E family protein of Tat protein translocase
MGIDSPVHLIFIGVVALLVLGPKRLPEVARALGHGLREFREAMNLDGEPTIEHAPVVSQPVEDPSAPGPASEPTPVAVQQAPPQGDPLADSFVRAEAAHGGGDPAGPLPSADAPDRRPL